MIKVEFVGLNKSKAIRKALDFWYKKLFGILTLEEFAEMCTWKKVDMGYIVNYKGPKPK